MDSRDIIIYTCCSLGLLIYLPFTLKAAYLIFNKYHSDSDFSSQMLIFVSIPITTVDSLFVIPITLLEIVSMSAETSMYMHTALLVVELFLVMMSTLVYVESRGKISHTVMKSMTSSLILVEFVIMAAVLDISETNLVLSRDEPIMFYHIAVPIVVFHALILSVFLYIYRQAAMTIMGPTKGLILTYLLLSVISGVVMYLEYGFPEEGDTEHAYWIDEDAIFMVLFYTLTVWIRIYIYHHNYKTICCCGKRNSNAVQPAEELTQVLSTKVGVARFLSHLEKQYCSENMLWLIEYSFFLTKVSDHESVHRVHAKLNWIKPNKKLERFSKAEWTKYLFKKFIEHNAAFQLNLPSSAVKSVLTEMNQAEDGDGKGIDYSRVFQKVNIEVVKNLGDSYSRFLRDSTTSQLATFVNEHEAHHFVQKFVNEHESQSDYFI